MGRAGPELVVKTPHWEGPVDLTIYSGSKKSIDMY